MSTNTPPPVIPAPSKGKQFKWLIPVLVAVYVFSLVAVGVTVWFIAKKTAKPIGPAVELTMKREDTVGGPNYTGYVKNNLERTLTVTVNMRYTQSLIGEKAESQTKFIQPGSIEEFKFRLWPTQTFKSMDVVEAR